MNFHNRIPETKEGRVIKVITVSQKYIDCKKEIDKVCWDINKLIASTKHVLEDEILGRMPDELVKQYQHCLEYTMSIALEDVDRMIEYYNITSDEEIKLLKQDLTKLLDVVYNLI